MFNIALVGNPNCGKTTLFNTLTGVYQRVGNWTGVTNEIKTGQYKKDKQITITDLPGLYSLRAKSNDELACLNFLIKTPPNVIINVIDATNLERNLYLTCELISLGLPMVIALNMCDQLNKSGIKVNTDNISKTFGVPVISVSALKNINVDTLISTAHTVKNQPKILDLTPYKQSTLTEKYYSFIERHIGVFVTKKRTRLQNFTQKADDFLMHKIWGIPIFFAVMTLVYFLSINIGGIFGRQISKIFNLLSETIAENFIRIGIADWLISLTCDAVIDTIGGVTSFLPQILILFLLMAIIEDSGYAARAAFLFDRFFQTFGLGGKSLMPMIVSCGCSVTGLMSTRIIDGESERKMTVFLSPFMPCGAKTAVFAWFSHVFFNGSALIAASMYFLGIICVGLFGNLLKRLKPFRVKNNGFIMEIPTLRAPSFINVCHVLKEKVKEFITKAGLTVFAVSVLLWLLKSVGLSGYVGENVENSFLYGIGNALKWIFYPLGFGNWQATVAVISGTFAKEAIVETLELLCSDVGAIFYAEYSAYAFMAFVLLSPPCIASLATAKRELGSFKWFAFMCLFQFVSAYFVAAVINILGFLICSFKNLILTAFIVIIISVGVLVAIKRLKRCGCTSCGQCAQGDKKCRKKAKRFTT